MGIPLYKIAAEYREIMLALENSELPEEVVADTLEGESGDLIDKLAATVATLLNIEAEADAVAAAKDRMAAREKALRGRAEWLRNYVINAMRATKTEEVNTPEFVAKVGKGGESLVIADDAAFEAANREAHPEWFREIPPTERSYAPDKTVIKGAIKGGTTVDGATIKTSYKLLVK